MLETYGDRVRFVFKHNPLSFHDKALLAAEASMAAAAQGKFWEYHDKLFENQQMLDRASLESYAEELGLDMARFKADLDNHAHLAHIRADQEEAAEVKASGTPTFFVNGRKLEGNSFDDFKAIIEEEVAAARKLLDKGTAPEALYDTIIAKGKVFKPLEDTVHTFDLKGSPAMGKAPARITIVEFSDFQ